MSDGQDVWSQYRCNWRSEAATQKPLKCAGLQKFNTTLTTNGAPAGPILVYKKSIGTYTTIQNEEIVTVPLYNELVFAVVTDGSDMKVICLDAEDGSIQWSHTVNKTLMLDGGSSFAVSTLCAGDGAFIHNDHLYLAFRLAITFPTGDSSGVKKIALGVYEIDLSGTFVSAHTHTVMEATGQRHNTFGVDVWYYTVNGKQLEYSALREMSCKRKESNIYAEACEYFFSYICGGGLSDYTDAQQIVKYDLNGNVGTHLDGTATSGQYSSGSIIGLTNDKIIAPYGRVSGGTANNTQIMQSYTNGLQAKWYTTVGDGISGIAVSHKHSLSEKETAILGNYAARGYVTPTYYAYSSDGILRWSKTVNASGLPCIYEYSTLITGNVPIYVYAHDGVIESFSDPLYAGVGVVRNWSQSNANIKGMSAGNLPVCDSWGIYLSAGLGVIGYSLDGTLLFEYLPGVSDVAQEVALGEQYLYTYIIPSSNTVTLHALSSSYGLETLDITETDPADTAVDVEPSSAITVTFTKEVDYTTVTTSSLKILNGITELAYTITEVNEMKVVVQPDAALPVGATITLQCSTDIESVEGYALHAAHSFSFTVGTAAFEVTSFSPGNGAMDVPLDAVLSVTFNYDLDGTTVSTGTCALTDEGGVAVAYISSVSGDTLTLTPAELDTDTEYTLVLATGLHSTGGLALNTSTTFSFTTELKALEDPDDTEDYNESSEISIESPDDTFSEWTDLLISPPRFSGINPPWRIHIKVEAYADSGHTTLNDTKSSEANPELFSYSADGGVTWRAYPSTGLPAVQYQDGCKVRVRIKTGRGATAYLIPYYGAEPA